MCRSCGPLRTVLHATVLFGSSKGWGVGWGGSRGVKLMNKANSSTHFLPLLARLNLDSRTQSKYDTKTRNVLLLMKNQQKPKSRPKQLKYRCVSRFLCACSRADTPQRGTCVPRGALSRSERVRVQVSASLPVFVSNKRRVAGRGDN